MTATGLSAINLQAAWLPAEVFTGDQRLTCELRLLGRLRDRLADSTSLLKARGLTTIDAAPQVPRVSGLEQGILNRDRLIACGLVGAEPPDPDAVPMTDRYALFEGHGWTLSGIVGVPAGSDTEHQVEGLLRSRFHEVRQATFRVAWGGRLVEWTVPETHVNTEAVTAAFLS